jgi:hypothetical protein
MTSRSMRTITDGSSVVAVVSRTARSWRPQPEELSFSEDGKGCFSSVK